MKEIFYSNHLEFRLTLREIPYSLPKKIYETAKERYVDKATLKYVAVKRVRFKNKLREMVVVYEEHQDFVTLITIHPLKVYQKITRRHSARWQRL